MEVMSVFLTAPIIQVLHGRRELGLVDRSSLLTKRNDHQTVLSLGGRSWLVRTIDWGRGIAYAEPAADAGRSRWKGLGPSVGFVMCRRIRDMLATDVEREWWSRRAREAITEARADYPWLTTEATTVLAEPNESMSWWTFAGRSVNAALATAVRSRIEGKVVHDNFAIKIETGSSLADLEACIADIRRQPIESLLPEIDADAVTALKFSDCIPRGLAEQMLQRMAADPSAITIVLSEQVRLIARVN